MNQIKIFLEGPLPCSPQSEVKAKSVISIVTQISNGKLMDILSLTFQKKNCNFFLMLDVFLPCYNQLDNTALTVLIIYRDIINYYNYYYSMFLKW